MLGLRGSALRKPYSIASAPWEVEKSGTLQVLVQVEDSGGPDPHLELASPGTEVDIEGPFGSFSLPERVANPLLFIAGGTGIAPLRSMLFDYVSRAFTHRPVLIYSARSIDEFAFRSELTALEAAARVTNYFTVTREERPDWAGRRGRISAGLIKEALPSADSICLICGPPQLVSDASVLLVKLGVREDSILTEKY